MAVSDSSRDDDVVVSWCCRTCWWRWWCWRPRADPGCGGELHLLAEQRLGVRRHRRYERADPTVLLAHRFLADCFLGRRILGSGCGGGHPTPPPAVRPARRPAPCTAARRSPAVRCASRPYAWPGGAFSLGHPAEGETGQSRPAPEGGGSFPREPLQLVPHAADAPLVQPVGGPGARPRPRGRPSARAGESVGARSAIAARSSAHCRIVFAAGAHRSCAVPEPESACAACPTIGLAVSVMDHSRYLDNTGRVTAGIPAKRTELRQSRAKRSLARRVGSAVA